MAAVAGFLLVAAAVVGLLDPHGIVGSSTWAIAVLGVLWGYGAVLERRLAAPLGPGQKLLLGGVAWIVLVGVLLAGGLASRGPLLALAMTGLALALVDIVRLGRGGGQLATPVVREAPGVFVVLGALLLVYSVLHVVGTITGRGNPYDDHIAYTAFVKRLLDCGDLIEPFSYRRISAYGGQTALLALAAVRGDVESTDLLDRGLFQVITILLVLDLARARRIHPAVTTLIVLFLAFLQDVSINSASQWTGLASFLGAYGFATDDRRGPHERLLLAFAVCAAACTLRQNYLLPAGLFAALLLVFHVRESASTRGWRAAIINERTTILATCGIALGVLLPYMVATYRSNDTFLYPLILGTANPAAPLNPSAATFADKISFFVTIALESEPIRIWWLLGPLMLFTRDPRPGRPWTAFLIASAIGFGLMINSFMLSDASTLWRYAYAYLTALALIYLIEAVGRVPFVEGADEEPVAPLRTPPIVAWLVWLAVISQMLQSRGYPRQRLRQLVDSLQVALVHGTDRTGAAESYANMQSVVPSGSRVAILLDDPYLIDYSRQEIVNLDLPGFVAPAPGLPSFLGAARWRAYFTSQGIRYLAYTDFQRSTYLYRRRGWLARMFTESELWRFMSAHMIDTIDTFEELTRTSTVLFRKDGLVMIDLGSTSRPAEEHADDLELVRQDAFVRRISEQEFGDLTWQLASRRDVVFTPDGYGPSGLQFDMLGQPPPHWGGLLRLFYGGSWRVPSHRWLTDRTHVRLRGEGLHHLRLRIHVNEARLNTIPTATVRIDGGVVGRAEPDADGFITIEGTASCRAWCDAYITFSTMSEFWLGADSLRAFKLLEFEWDSASSR